MSLHVFGCDAYVYDEKAKFKEKMAPRAWIGKLVGYEGTNQYRIYDPVRRAVHIQRNVVFNEALQQMNTNSKAPVGASECYGIDLSGWALPTVSSDQRVVKTIPITTTEQEAVVQIEQAEAEIYQTEQAEAETEHPDQKALNDALEIVNQGLHDLRMNSLVGAHESELSDEQDKASPSSSFPSSTERLEREAGAQTERPEWEVSAQTEHPEHTRGREGLRNLPRIDYQTNHGCWRSDDFLRD